MKVLIADGNRLLLEGFRRALERVEDIEVAGVAWSGLQLLEMAKRRQADVVAVDIDLRMPSGESCLDLLREGHPALKRVALSYSSSQDVVRSALLRGASAVIVKSVNPLDIPAALRQAHEETVYHAFGFQPAPEDALREAGLTAREITMLKALARGMSNKAICQELWISEPTVKYHLGNLYRKLGVPNRLAAASFAHGHGLGGSSQVAA